MEDIENMENLENMETVNNIENVETVENIENMATVANLETTTIVEGITNATNSTWLSRWNAHTPWHLYGLFYYYVFFAISIGVIGLLLFTYIANRWGYKAFKSKKSMRNKTVIITGTTSGIGLETARNLAKRGARLILACRNVEKATVIADELKKESGNEEIFVRRVDTSSMESVRAFCKITLEDEDRIDVLILNAGMTSPHNLTRTKEKPELEMTMATNHFGHFLMINLLMGRILDTRNSRVIFVTSFMHYAINKFKGDNLNFEKSGSYNFISSYCLSKFCNVTTMKYLAAITEGSSTTVNCVCPGFVYTPLYRKSDARFFSNVAGITSIFTGRTPEEGCQSIVYTAVSDDLNGVTGSFIMDQEFKKVNELAEDPALIKKIWEASEYYVKLEDHERTF